MVYASEDDYQITVLITSSTVLGAVHQNLIYSYVCTDIYIYTGKYTETIKKDYLKCRELIQRKWKSKRKEAI